MADRWLEQLTVGHLFYPLDSTTLHDQDHAEALDATYEDANGRLPHEPGYDRGAAPVPAPVPDLIPDWVLADADALLAQGYTLQRVARAVLPVTDCEDVLSCEEQLRSKLAQS